MMVVGIDGIPRTMADPAADLRGLHRAGVTGVGHELSVSGAPGLIFDIN